MTAPVRRAGTTLDHRRHGRNRPDRVDPLVRAAWQFAQAYGMNQEQFAKAAGLDKGMVSRILRGLLLPSTITARALANAVECDIQLVPRMPGGRP